MSQTIHDRVANEYRSYYRQFRLNEPAIPDVKNALCPIDFGDFARAPNFYQLERYHPPFDWRNKIVGLVEDGLLCVTHRESRVGYYIYYPTLVRWQQLHGITLASKFSFGRFAIGIIILAISVTVLIAVGMSQFGHLQWDFELLLRLFCCMMFWVAIGLAGCFLCFSASRFRVDVFDEGEAHCLDIAGAQFPSTNWFFEVLLFYCDENAIPIDVSSRKLAKISRQTEDVLKK